MSFNPVIPPWPPANPEYGHIRLRRFTNLDVEMAMNLSTDRYVPIVGTLPAYATKEQALDWIERQQRRHHLGTGFSFAIADRETNRCVGNIGLWVGEMGAGRAHIGYGIAPKERGHGLACDALNALTHFAWTLPSLHRLELYIEPWNSASIRTAERSRYQREGLLRSHQEIGGERRDMLLYSTVRSREHSPHGPR